MKTVLDDMGKCVGCSSCVQRCARNCITMKADSEGFLFPEINAAKCVDCGSCRKVCPVYDTNSSCLKSTFKDAGQMPPKVYACWNNNDDTRFNSSSGGLFSLFAEAAVKKDGAVFGAAFDEKFHVKHTCVRNTADIETQRGSKYVQSVIGENYLEAEKLLKAGNSVLFTGTPCQIAGLKAFLGKAYENLLTIDLACHGVPSPRIWDMYLSYMKDTYKSDLQKVSFRNKKDGWSKSSMRLDFKNGKTYIENVYKETYFIGFGKGIFNRKCCFNCDFKLQNTKSDITLADFWGIEKLNGIDASDNKGVSLLITNTPKGSDSLAEIYKDITFQERTFEEAVKGNPRLLTSSNFPEARTKFFSSVNSGITFEKLMEKYMDNKSFAYKIKTVVKSILGPKLIDSLNKLRTP